MIETIIFWTGVVVWLLALIYVAPLLPYLVLTLCGVAVGKVGQWFTDMYLTSESRAGRLQELSRRHDEDDWLVVVSIRLGRLKRWLYGVAEQYGAVLDRTYVYLPLV